MSRPPTQASSAPGNDAQQPRHRARKRRKYNHAKNSIYLTPTVEPYHLAIKQREPSAGPSSGYAPINEDGEIIEAATATTSVQISSTVDREKRKDEGKGKEKEKGTERDKPKDPRYQAGALKAWETKRQRQKERFEQLEASTSLLGLGRSGSGLPFDLDLGDDHSWSDRGSIPAWDPLLDVSFDVSDVPKDDMLQSLQSYSSRYYTANNLLQQPYKQGQRLSQGIKRETRRSLSRTTTPSRPMRDEGSGSEYDANQAEADEDGNNDKEEGLEVETEMEDGPRKRGGQRGKRKLKDMYLALDGSALLTLGVLIQEQIITKLRQEGYVPASTLEVEVETEAEDEDEDGATGEVEDVFEISDDSDEEND